MVKSRLSRFAIVASLAGSLCLVVVILVGPPDESTRPADANHLPGKSPDERSEVTRPRALPDMESLEPPVGVLTRRPTRPRAGREDEQLLIAKGKVLQLQGDTERALQYFRKAAVGSEESETRSAAVLAAAELQSRQRRPADAIKFLDRFLPELDGEWRGKALILKGRSLSQLQRHTESVEVLSDACRYCSDDARRRFAKEHMLRAHQAAGTLDNAIRTLDEQLAETPNDEGALQDLLLIHTKVRPNTGNAIQTAQRLLEIRPRDVTLLHQLADVALSAQDGPTAVAACERLLQLDPGNTRMLNGRMLSAYTIVGDSDKALECARRMFDGQAPTATSLSAFAGICSRLGKTQDAVSALQQALGRSPEAAQRDAITLSLAGLYRRAGENGQANKLYQLLVDESSSTQTRETARRLLAESEKAGNAVRP